MAICALDFMAKVSSRFVHEILPVATASVIGAMLVNHYGRQPAAPPIVIQAQPSVSEDAMVKSLRQEHELIASFVKRNQEEELTPSARGAPRRRSHRLLRPPFPSRIPHCPSHDRQRRRKRLRGSRQKPRSRKSPGRRRRRYLSGPCRQLRQRPHRFWPPCLPRLELSPSRGRGLSSASPAPWVGGLQTWSGAGAVAFLPAGLIGLRCHHSSDR